jgi:multiple sugar transport system substrate-binding protein
MVFNQVLVAGKALYAHERKLWIEVRREKTRDIRARRAFLTLWHHKIPRKKGEAFMSIRNASVTRVVCILISVVLLLGVVTGCGTKTASRSKDAEKSVETVKPEDLKGEISLWAWGTWEKDGAVDFNKHYPNIKVNYVIIPDTEYPKKVQMTVASGGDLPDIVLFEIKPRGRLIAIDAWERLDAPPYNFNKNDLVPFAIPLMQNPKGEIVCIQGDNDVGGYIYNRPLAKRYFGTDDPSEMEKIFTSWDVYIEKGKEIVQKSQGKSFLFSGADDAFYALIGLYTKEPFVVNSKITLDTTVLPTFKVIEQLIKDKSVGKYLQWSPSWNASFASNTIVFYPAASWFVPFVVKPNDKNAKGKYGLISPPGGGFSWGGTGYAIPKTCKNKTLAWAWIKWWCLSEEGTRALVKTHGIPSLYKASYDTDIYISDENKDPFFAGQNVLAKLLEISKNANTQARPITAYDSLVMDACATILRQMEQGMSANEAYGKLKDELIKQAPELTK